MLSGKRGKAEVCVVRSSNVICAPSQLGTVTRSGKKSLTGVSRVSSPRTTMSANSIPVNTLVIEPIS